MKSSITYKVRPGDTFESVARIQYGTELEADYVRGANPGAIEPLSAGTELNTPPVPGTPTIAPSQAAFTREDEVQILIEGERFRWWNSIRIVRSLDAMDIVEFSAPFEPDNPTFRRTFKPLSYKNVEITIQGEHIFTGTMVAVDPLMTPDENTVNVGAYSVPGKLADVAPSSNAYPLEFLEVGLEAIATRLCKPLGVGVKFTADAGDVFPETAIAPNGRVLPFLANLARQRGLIISSTPEGELLFQQSIEPGDPVATLRGGESPLLSVIPFTNSKAYFSTITGITPTFLGFAGSATTVKNPRLSGSVRPETFIAEDTEDADILTAVTAKLGRMYGNAITYKIQVATWNDPQGNQWKPNTSIILNAPRAMVYSDYEMIIRTVELQRSPAQDFAELTLVLPGAFSGKAPDFLPWEE